MLYVRLLLLRHSDLIFQCPSAPPATFAGQGCHKKTSPLKPDPVEGGALQKYPDHLDSKLNAQSSGTTPVRYVILCGRGPRIKSPTEQREASKKPRLVISQPQAAFPFTLQLAGFNPRLAASFCLLPCAWSGRLSTNPQIDPSSDSCLLGVST